MTLNDPLFTPDEAGAALKTNPRTLERWRTEGNGPRYVKLGRRVAYRQSDLEQYVRKQVRQHTGEAGR